MLSLFIDPCPNPPTRGALELFGLSLGSGGVFRQSGTGLVRFSATIIGCTYSRVAVVWTINGKPDEKFATSLSYPLQLSEYKAGTEHRVSATVEYYDADNKAIAKLEASTSFWVLALPLVAKVVEGEKAVPLSLDLVVDASPSYDEMDRCYVASYVGLTALRNCLTANSVSAYNTSATTITFTFRCVDETTGGACPFTGLEGAFPKDDGLYIVRFNPLLTIPAASLVEGTFVFSVSVSRDTRNAGPSNPVRFQVVNKETYVTIQKLELQGATFETTFVSTKKMQILGRALTNSKTPAYAWTLNKATGPSVSMADKEKFYVDQATLM